MGFWEGFRAGWGIGTSIGDALDAREIRKAIADARTKAAEEAARSGRRVELLPEDQIRQGYGVTTASGDYVTRDKDTADMIMQQERNYIDLQKDPGRHVTLYGLGGPRRTPEPMGVNQEPTLTRKGFVSPDGSIAMEKEQLPGYGMASQIPPMSADEIFNRKYAPAIIEKLRAQNRFKEADAFQNWVQDQRNQRYGALWMEAMNARMMGDLTGAAEKLQALYNLQVPDGQYAVLMPDKDGSFVAQIRDNETNRINRQFKGSLDNIVDMGLGALSPQARVEALLRGQQRDAKTYVIPPGGALVSGDQVLFERPFKDAIGVQKEPRWEKPARNPETGKWQAWRKLPDGTIEWAPGEYPDQDEKPTASRRSSRSSRSDRNVGGLTTAQQRYNAEIEDARRQVKILVDAGMDVTKRAKIDPELAKLLEKANKRKYGELGERPMIRDTRPLIEWARGRDPNVVRERALKKGWRPDEIEEAIQRAR